MIHPSVKLGRNPRIGHNVFVREDTTIGDNVTLGSNVVIEGRCQIGNNVSLQTGAYVSKYTVIKNDCFLGPYCLLLNDKYPPSADDLKGPTIEDHAVIGGGATILPGIIVGSMGVVGAGSVVTRNVKSNTIVVGNPARELDSESFAVKIGTLVKHDK